MMNRFQTLLSISTCAGTPGVQQRGPHGEHPAHRRGGQAVQRHRRHHAHLLHLPLPRRPPEGARHRGRAVQHAATRNPEP